MIEFHYANVVFCCFVRMHMPGELTRIFTQQQPDPTLAATAAVPAAAAPAPAPLVFIPAPPPVAPVQPTPMPMPTSALAQQLRGVRRGTSGTHLRSTRTWAPLPLSTRMSRRVELMLEELGVPARPMPTASVAAAYTELRADIVALLDAQVMHSSRTHARTPPHTPTLTHTRTYTNAYTQRTRAHTFMHI